MSQPANVVLLNPPTNRLFASFAVASFWMLEYWPTPVGWNRLLLSVMRFPVPDAGNASRCFRWTCPSCSE
jgi:hypothetical protein